MPCFRHNIHTDDDDDDVGDVDGADVHAAADDGKEEEP